MICPKTSIKSGNGTSNQQLGSPAPHICFLNQLIKNPKTALCINRLQIVSFEAAALRLMHVLYRTSAADWEHMVRIKNRALPVRNRNHPELGGTVLYVPGKHVLACGHHNTGTLILTRREIFGS